MNAALGRPRPVCLIVLDGWGLCEPGPGNACRLAPTPFITSLLAEYPNSSLIANGEAVGLEPGQMGDSNVGHLNIGAGRIVYQDLTRIDRSVSTGEIYRNPALLRAIDHVLKSGGRLHLMGLVSPGGVHSHTRHLIALIGMAYKGGVRDVMIHCFMDGRDTPPMSGKSYIEGLESNIAGFAGVRIGTVIGRYYAMDRDKRWERTKVAFDALARAVSHIAPSAAEALGRSYDAGVTDEFVSPVTIEASGHNGIHPRDAIIFFNFRADRARQIVHSLVDRTFSPFDRGSYKPVLLVAMARYEEGLDIPVAFPPQHLKNTLGEVLSREGLRQLRIAETEKYAHVTFFLNGMEEKPFEGEDRILIQSPKVATYDLKPEMSAPQVTEAVLREIRAEKYDVIILNLANLDMVGHTGDLRAACMAVETVDRSLARIIPEVISHGGAALICADHGNAESMMAEGGGPQTAHTSNPVPFILVDPSRKDKKLRNGILADVAPTLLEVLGLDQPAEMDGKSLITRD